MQMQMQKVLECLHYQRKCHVEAPCCKIYYPCKLCHDEKFQFNKGCQIQRMEFQKVENIKCLNCQYTQIPSQTCKNCHEKFGEYTCVKCRLYQNNPQKINDIFHCQDCKMCRRGTKQTVTHCFTCKYCVPNQNKKHKCIINNSQSQCPICLEVLIYSTKGFVDLRCGHLIHVQCLENLQDINCPLCGMASYKMRKSEIRTLDRRILRSKARLPVELKDKKVNIICNECLHKTMNAPFHYYGIKCQKCKTYNTKMM